MTKTELNQKQEIKKVTTVEVSLPSCVQIELVQGNELRHYEIFSLASSLLLSTAVGFWTGYLTTDANSKALFASALAFSVFAILAGVFAWHFRRKLYNGKVTKVATLDDFQSKD